MSFSRFSRDDLEIVKKIGSGGTSSVHHAILKSKTSEDTHVAAKKLYETNEDEVELLSKLSHPNIIKLIGVVSDTFDCILILELCELGSLRAYIDKHGRKPLPSDLFDDWSKQAAKAIEYLQDQHIVHKDIKSDNYVISSDSSAMVLKLIDFGFAKEMELSLSNASCKGTFRYMAPELLKTKKLSATKYDIWAYGVVVWEMLTGKIPYEGFEYAQIVWYICDKNKRLEIPKDCPDYITELLYRCWQGDHKQRPDIHEVLVELDTKECNILNQWELQNQFGHEDGPDTPKLDQAFGLAVDREGNIAVHDNRTYQTRIYDCNGLLTQSCRSPPQLQTYTKCLPLVTGPNGVILTTINSYERQLVEVFEPTRNQKKAITILGKNESSGTLGGLAFDKYDNLLVGICDHRLRSISSSFVESDRTHRCSDLSVNLIVVMEFRKALDLADQDGEIKLAEERQIPVKQRPTLIAVTPLDTIIVSNRLPSDQQITLINFKGEVLHILNPPPQVTHWRPCGICCSSDNIFITNDNLLAPDEDGVYCYSLSGDYLGCATKEVTNPTGIAVTHDGNKMVVAQWETGTPEEGQGKHGVKVFQKKSK